MQKLTNNNTKHYKYELTSQSTVMVSQLNI